MNENHINNICNDGMLRKAATRHEARMPQMPSGLNERLMERVHQTTATRIRVRWICGAAASIAAIAIALATLIPRTGDDTNSKDAALAVANLPHSHVQPSNNATRQEQAEDTSISVEKTDNDKTKTTVREQAQSTDNNQTGKAKTLADEQANTAEYIAQLAKMYKAVSIPLDCHNEGNNMVYVFNDNGHVMQDLGMLALWIDTDKPGVSITLSPDQMTLELGTEDTANGMSEVWLADRKNGLVYLYHSQTRGEHEYMTDCYMSFIGHNDCKRSN